MRKNDISGVDFLLVLILLTRLPLPRLDTRQFARHAHAVWAFPIAGLAVAVPACLIAQVSLWTGLESLTTAGLAIGVQILLTGAMHEDGLADTADGFWGGFDRARRLDIMKDSHIGTYGVLALIVTVGLRWVTYASIITTAGPWALVPLAMLSRAMMPVIMTVLPNARGSGLSQSVGRPTPRNCALGLGLAAAGAVLILGWVSFGVILAMAGATVSLAVAARVKIGGQTGDVLGATQQLSELAGLLMVAALIA
ncbi:adenosylcobinamide-GDP ribazoletransferase [Phaeobacter porticola]|uniref:Adenosylcobinamide-GDP ribazoletransferase n=1 Tax=Phaeobacter porticola TaxID=1844006 RepID=A0A1L3I6U5_9RHOB|nr:adenosylcobinamide-GDP ribazoletransferase [Phaeobacter porticola]APG47820.1 putative cobalamin-5-phosphate synthase [Phaeobacter porticola]